VQAQTELKKRILDEMTIKHSTILSESFELAKQYVRLREDGLVDLLVRDKLSGKDQILLYLIGKMYAKEASLTNDENVGTTELLDQLGVPEGSLFPWLKELRDSNQIRQVKRENNVYHTVLPAKVYEILTTIQKKLA
jgi:hypothetical protein